MERIVLLLLRVNPVFQDASHVFIHTVRGLLGTRPACEEGSHGP